MQVIDGGARVGDGHLIGRLADGQIVELECALLKGDVIDEFLLLHGHVADARAGFGLIKGRREPRTSPELSVTEYPASTALFTSGKAALHINRVWEIPTMVDLAKKGQIFDWGAIQIPTFYAHPATWADSHSFAIPDRKGDPVPAAKRKLVLDTIHWFNEHSLEWAGGGHIPAYPNRAC